ncbi:MAG: HD-GYP domain-containing protein [Armatimonadota bacterium]|nr:HD-GYP domain-containing protein [Armatimonadota bacterium]MDR7456893.1 HD-GYP domain-containing protein [Armatimonadota bacterium]MDR7495624.1 HD-GYP domain-containing protein [Armatimonadota bacterium]
MIDRTGLLRLWPLLVVGGAIGVALPGGTQSDPWAVALFTALGVACEWLEIRLGPLGFLTLRPMVAFVALWRGGLSAYMVVGLISVIAAQLLARRRSFVEVIDEAGREVVALGLSSVAYSNIAGSPGVALSAVAHRLLAGAVVMLVYWGTKLALRVAQLSHAEGMRPQQAARSLLRHAWPHLIVMIAGAVGLSFIESDLGLVVTGLAAVMFIEAYYPWKLLGEQGGVLLTSLQMMAQAVDLKDPYTSNHSQRVSRYAVRLARTMGLPEEEVERIRIGALMHDIGKIGISGRIIRKPGRLSPEERVKMQQHSAVSADIIEPLEILGESARMVRHHHENWDGTGYPAGLRGEEIPLGSRIILVADAFDALVTDRPYRKGASRPEALNVIRKHAGTQFDPVVVRALERVYTSL